MPAYLVDVPEDEMLDIVNINVTATLRVTYAVLPGMVQRCVCFKPFPSIANLIFVLSQEAWSHPQHWLLRRRSPLPHARALLRHQSLPLNLL